MKKINVIIILLLACLLINSCATILTGTNKKIPVSSDPFGAKIVVKNEMGQVVFTGTTPNKLVLPKNHSYTVEFSMEGYKTNTVYLSKSFNPLFIGNLICGGLIGIIVDLATGAYMDIRPNTINCVLETDKLGMNDQPNNLYVKMYLVDQDNHKHKVIVPLEKL